VITGVGKGVNVAVGGNQTTVAVWVGSGVSVAGTGVSVGAGVSIANGLHALMITNIRYMGINFIWSILMFNKGDRDMWLEIFSALFNGSADLNDLAPLRSHRH
jgi:hypothetical protein